MLFTLLAAVLAYSVLVLTKNCTPLDENFGSNAFIGTGQELYSLAVLLIPPFIEVLTGGCIPVLGVFRYLGINAEKIVVLVVVGNHK